MSAHGTKLTCEARSSMSASRGAADLALSGNNFRFDPKQTKIAASYEFARKGGESSNKSFQYRY